MKIKLSKTDTCSLRLYKKKKKNEQRLTKMFKGDIKTESESFSFKHFTDEDIINILEESYT